MELKSLAKQGAELSDLLLKTNNIDFKSKPIRLSEIRNSDYKSFIHGIETQLFSNKSKEAYKILSHSSNLKPHKKEGCLATCFWKDVEIGE